MTFVDTEAIVASLLAFAQTRPELVALYLYGSHATGTARRDSDIDVAVLLASSVDALARTLLWNSGR